MRLRVDPIACTGHGICAELLPLVRRALNACPALALRLEREHTGAGR